MAIGPGHPPLVIAEAGVNHNGDLGLARQLVDAARQAGAGAVKFQTFRSESVVSPLARQATYQQVNTGVTESQLEMVRRLELTADDTRRLSNYCTEAGVVFLSSPFDEDSAELLVSLGVPALKVGRVRNDDVINGRDDLRHRQQAPQDRRSLLGDEDLRHDAG